VDKVKQAIHEGRLMGICHKKSKSPSQIIEMIEVMTENYEF